MVHLNVYECQFPEDDLRIWRYPSFDKDRPQSIDERFDSVTIDMEASPTIAVPTNADGREVLEEGTGYEQSTVPWQDYLAISSNLVQYGTIKHLVNHHDFVPLQVDQNDARTNRVNEVYKLDPIAEPVDGLEIRQGLKVRSRFWDLPDHGPFVGLIFAYTTTNYFIDPLDEVLDGTDQQDYWLKMNCPSDCPHEDCTFHGHSGLIGQFDGFAASGEECQYDDGSDRFVSLSLTVDGISTNPPVERVAIEPSYDNIRQWATDKYGAQHSDIIEDIGRDRLGIPEYLDDYSGQEFQYEWGRLEELVGEIDRDITLPTGQTVTIADEPMEIVT